MSHKEFIDLKAKTNEVIVIEPPVKGSSPGVYLEKCECINPSKPYDRAEVESLIEKALSLGPDSSSPALTPKQMLKHHLDNFNVWNEQRHNDEMDSAELFKNNQIAKITTSPAYEKIASQADRDQFIKDKTKEIEDNFSQRAKEINQKTSDLKQTIQDNLNFFYVKRKIDYPLNGDDQSGDTVDGICLGADIDYRSKNPFSLNSMRVSIVLVNGIRQVTLKLSDPFVSNIVQATLSKSDVDMARSIYFSDDLIENWDDITKESRKDFVTKLIITGNIERALTNEDFKRQSALISFSNADGKTRDGLLLSEDFKVTTPQITIPILKALALLVDMAGDKKDQFSIAQTGLTITKNKRYWIIQASDNDKAIYLDEAFSSWALHKWEKKGNVWQLMIDNKEDLSKAIEYLDSRYGLSISIDSDIFQANRDKLGYQDAINEDMGIVPDKEPEIEATGADTEQIQTPQQPEAKLTPTEEIGSVALLSDLEKKKLRYYLGRYREETATKRELEELANVIDRLNQKMPFSELGKKQVEEYLKIHKSGNMKLYQYNSFADIILKDFEDTLFKNKKVNVN